MLILTVKDRGEVIITLEDGRRLTVVLVETEKGKARLGFDGPRSITVNRASVQAEIDAGRSRDKKPTGSAS